MAEYIEREAAIAVIEEKQKELCPVGMYSRHAVYGSDREKFDEWQEIIDALESIPAADVRPVVLCRDCVYAYPYGLEIKCTKHSGRADRFGEDATCSEFHDESWFCADGEERKHE